MDRESWKREREGRERVTLEVLENGGEAEVFVVGD